MATILDTGLLNFFVPIFVFVFVWVLVYAILIKSKLFGDNKALDATLAFAVSLLLIIVPEARNIITLFTPWFTLLVVLTLFLFLFFMMLGVKQDTITSVATKNTAFISLTVTIIVVLFLIALTKTYGPFLMVNQDPGFWNAVKRTLFHPKVFGAFFILLIASYTVGFLSMSDKK